MAIDFPSNRDQLVPPQPAGPIQDGDVYIYQGTTYTAKILGIPPDDSVQWNAATSAGNEGYVLKVGDTMTGQLTLPGGGTGKQAATVDQVTAVDTASVAKAGDTMTGQLTLPGGGTGNQAATVNQVNAVSTASVAKAGDTMTGNLTVPSLNGGPLSGMRNVLINSDFRIWQRGTVVTSSEFGPDRWRGAVSAAISEWRQRVNGNVPECPLAAEVTSPGGASDFVFQPIELPATGNPGPFAIGTTWTFSFWANVDMIPNWDMSHCLQFADGSTAATNLTNAVSGGNAPPVVVETSASDPNWKRYAIKNLVIDTAPAASNTLLAVRLKLPTTAVRLGQCQLEPGPVATPLEIRPIATELALCQRYYQKFEVASVLFGGSVADGTAVGGSHTYMPFNTAMRAIPTALGNVTFTKEKGPGTITGVAFWQADPHGCRFNIGANAAGIYVVRVTQQPWFDAEL